ncbi:MAG: carboxypeptidase-like regulatory domain-containing protein, partial [Tannerella sp.]|nr:carboxypeptidase-like regulatory domain-containing protein [Tannerella sp.]
MRKKIWLTAVLSCLLTSAMAAPVVRIKGKVVEAGSETPIDFADILLFVKGKEQPVTYVAPNADGVFTFSSVEDGEYSLVVRSIGYDVYTKDDIRLSGVLTIDLGTIELKPLEQGLAEVEVVAQKKQIIYKLDRKVIDASSSLLASGGTAVDIL